MPGHGVGVCGGCVGCGVWVGAIVGFGVGIGVGFCVGLGVGDGDGTWVTIGLCMIAAAWPVVAVGVGVAARCPLPMAEPIQAKHKRIARMTPHPRLSLIFRVRVLYHLHTPGRFCRGGKLLYGGCCNCPGLACVGWV